MFGRGVTKKEQKMNLDPSILLRKNQGYFTKRLKRIGSIAIKRHLTFFFEKVKYLTKQGSACFLSINHST